MPKLKCVKFTTSQRVRLFKCDKKRLSLLTITHPHVEFVETSRWLFVGILTTEIPTDLISSTCRWSVSNIDE